eukprot:8468658-Prorocentrum_lima.AAC.1
MRVTLCNVPHPRLLSGVSFRRPGKRAPIRHIPNTGDQGELWLERPSICVCPIQCHQQGCSW